MLRSTSPPTAAYRVKAEGNPMNVETLELSRRRFLVGRELAVAVLDGPVVVYAEAGHVVVRRGLAL